MTIYRDLGGDLLSKFTGQILLAAAKVASNWKITNEEFSEFIQELIKYHVLTFI